MIEKIIEIANLGHFVDFRLRNTTEWNGSFKRINIVYAPNGSGKTTLSTILKSLSRNDLNLISLKKTFGSTEKPKVLIRQLNNPNNIRLEEDSWSTNNLKIEVFDINYIEEYLFAGSYIRKQNKTSLFKLLLGEQGEQLKIAFKPFISKRERYFKLKKSRQENPELTAAVEQEKQAYDNLIAQYEALTKPIYDNHIAVINKYLGKFTSYIRLTEFTYARNGSDSERFRIFPIFKVYNQKVTFSPPDPANRIGNAKYSMSEGDKSTIALSFFLARLEIQGISDKIIVFDDPLSSFDYSRRNATIHQLKKIAENAVQFILLTHDLGFAYDFADKCSSSDHITLKIENDGTTSSIGYHNFASEFLTATQRDIEVVKAYLEGGSQQDADKKEVVRCIRPVLEGVFKTKYFDLIKNNDWLGDIIAQIRDAGQESKLFRLKTFIDEVEELNDYSKRYHHATIGQREIPINNEELRRYIYNLMAVIEKI